MGLKNLEENYNPYFRLRISKNIIIKISFRLRSSKLILFRPSISKNIFYKNIIQADEFKTYIILAEELKNYYL